MPFREGLASIPAGIAKNSADNNDSHLCRPLRGSACGSSDPNRFTLRFGPCVGRPNDAIMYPNSTRVVLQTVAPIRSRLRLDMSGKGIYSEQSHPAILSTETLTIPPRA